MSVSESRVAKVIWRALGRHIEADHKLEVRRIDESEDLEIHCSWCGVPVMAGSPQIVRYIEVALKESGFQIVYMAWPVIEAV